MSSVATLQPATAICPRGAVLRLARLRADRIGQAAHRAGGAPPAGRPGRSEVLLGLDGGTGLVLFVVVLLLYMTTEVTPTDVRVWFGWVPVYRRVVPIGEFRRVEIVTFRPIADYGFWGIRNGPDGERT